MLAYFTPLSVRGFPSSTIMPAAFRILPTTRPIHFASGCSCWIGRPNCSGNEPGSNTHRVRYATGASRKGLVDNGG